MWLSYLVGLGVAINGRADNELDAGPAAMVAVGVHPEHGLIGAGLRLRAAEVRDGAYFQNTSSAVTDWTAHLHALDIALDLDVVVPPWTVEPWIGVHVARGTLETRYSEMDPQVPTPATTTTSLQPAPATRLAVGAMVALDVYARARHHVALFLEVETTEGEAHRSQTAMPVLGDSYAAVTFGLAYRR